MPGFKRVILDHYAIMLGSVILDHYAIMLGNEYLQDTTKRTTTKHIELAQQLSHAEAREIAEELWDSNVLHIFVQDVTPQKSPKQDWFVYMIQSETSGMLYTGISLDPIKRLMAHNGLGGAKATRRGRPWKIVHTERCESKVAAMQREREIKKLPRIRKLESLEETARAKLH